MSTALFELAISVPSRIKELHTLVDQARSSEQSNEALYNALCRATSVLLASHLEGFIKELTEAIMADLNEKLESFSDMPAAVQHTFCEKIAFFEGAKRDEIDDRVKQLKAFFSQNTVPIDLKAFTYKESPNRNPTAGFVEAAFNKIGVPDILQSMSNSKFEVVFDNDSHTNYKLLRDLSRFRANLFHYPYRILPVEYGLRSKRGRSTSSLWTDYITAIMTRRHRVAHGDTLENETTWEALRLDVVKLEVLVQGLMFSAATYRKGETKRRREHK